jgi:multicomponent Na+:H+ antiporter subunit D
MMESFLQFFSVLPPGMWMILGGLLMFPFPQKKLRWAVALLAPTFCLLALWHWHQESLLFQFRLGNYALEVMRPNDYSALFSLTFIVVALVAAIYGLVSGAARSELPAGYLYAGSAISVTGAGDLLSLFFFWEMMAVASLLIIWAGGTPLSRKAGMRYALLHLLGGILLLAGAGLQFYVTSSISLPEFVIYSTGEGASNLFFSGNVEADETGYLAMLQSLAAWLILIAVLMNAAALPFSAWLPDAYPESSPSGMVFLSAITTKTAIFVLLSLFAGTSLFLPLGLAMAVYGVIMALLADDIRRILCYCLINQLGFMVAVLAFDSDFAINAVAVQAICHILYNTLLVLSAGLVIQATGKRTLHDFLHQGGSAYHLAPARYMAIAGFMMMSLPLTAGFLGKSLLMEAAVKEEHAFLWFGLMASSAGVFIAVLRYIWLTFYHSGNAVIGLLPYPKRSASLLAAAITIACLGLGLWPSLLEPLLPLKLGYNPNSLAHAASQLQIMGASLLALWLGLRFLPIWRGKEPLDMDIIYRLWLGWVAKELERGAYALRKAVVFLGSLIVRDMVCSSRMSAGPGSFLNRTASLGGSLIFTVGFIGLWLLFSYML